LKDESGKSIQYTPEQEAAIKFRGGSLLVSAAAGSGKTKVLVDRLLSRVDEGEDIDSFLVITYTRAAAFELRERIYEDLLAKLAKSPGNKRLRRQSLLCRGAPIGTIHTFCAEVLRENAHLVRLPTDFRILDQNESKIMMTGIAGDITEKAYDETGENPGFTSLVDAITEGRDDNKLIETLLEIYIKVQSIPNPNAWIEDQIKKLSLVGMGDILETDCGVYIFNKMRTSVDNSYKEMSDLRMEMANYPEFEEKYSKSVDNTIKQISKFIKAFDIGWDEAVKQKNMESVQPNRISGYTELKDIRTQCLKNLNKRTEELTISSSEHIMWMKLLGPAITALYELLLKFDAAYKEEKRKKAAVDFSDLEHLTLSLLVDESTAEKTNLAENLAKRYKEIMIDEYQDVNAVQDHIFNAISVNKSNVFMVGDVKQSIYRFRLADPAIFLAKYLEFKEYREEISGFDDKNGTKIHLCRNFRSNVGILNTINCIFSNIMSAGFGEMEYTENESLKTGRITENVKQGKKGKPYIEEKNTPFQLDILDLSGFDVSESEEKPASIKVEADFIAGKIKDILSGDFMIPDEGGGERAAKASDVVILLRSIKGKAWQYAKSLSDRGIKSEYSSGEDFFEAIEIKMIIALLEIIDNPVQDMQLASVLCGPIYKLSADELAEIRANSPKNNYYEALKSTADDIIGSPETALKCKKILDDIDQLRSIKSEMSTDRFIWRVYNKTGLLGIVGGQYGGKRRRENLIKLAESARKFEQNGYKGLFGFLEYIRNLRERGLDPADQSLDRQSKDETSDIVRIMSVHKSKGLEFPIVFFANTASRFNFRDSYKSVVFHKDLGVGSVFTDRKERVKFTTLARSAIQSRLTDETLAEELRVMYVALTRAKEKLIITSVLKDARNTLGKIKRIKKGKVAPQVMLSMQSMAEWLLTGVRESFDSLDLTVKTSMEAVTENLSVRIVPVFNNNNSAMENNVILELVTGVQGLESDLQMQKGDLSIQKNESYPEIFSHYQEFEYPYQTSVDLPSKLTVTGISRMTDPDAERASWIRDSDSENRNYRRPEFISKRKVLAPVERGLLLHRVMQHIDYKRGSDESEIRKELQRLVNMGMLTSDEIGYIDKTRLIKFFNSSLGGRASTSDYLKKEFKFSILCPAGKYFPSSSDDRILLQGVVDCFFEEDKKLVVIDFKTDSVSEETVHEKVQKYTPQLDAYCDALSRITNKPVKERYIYFFAIDKAILLNN